MLKGMPFWSRTGLPLAFFAANRRQALPRSEEHTSELQSQSNLVCRLLLEKKKKNLQNLLTSRLPPETNLSRQMTHQTPSIDVSCVQEYTANLIHDLQRTQCLDDDENINAS